MLGVSLFLAFGMTGLDCVASGDDERTQLLGALERSPNRFVYEQMISLPSGDLIQAFDAADYQFRMAPQSKSVYISAFKALANAGNPLAMERVADMLLSDIEEKAQHELRYLDIQGHGMTYRRQGVYEEAAETYLSAFNLYKRAEQYYKSDSIYLSQLKSKVQHASRGLSHNTGVVEEAKAGRWWINWWICKLNKPCLIIGGIIFGAGTIGTLVYTQHWY